MTVAPRVHWIEHPAGTSAVSTIVLLHGLGSSADDWLLQIEPLSARRRVVAVDMPGHGRTPPFGGWPKLADYSAAVAATLEAIGALPAHIVGLSLGGAVGLQLCLDHPRDVRSLSLINTFARMRLTRMAWIRGGVRLALVLSGRMNWLGSWVAAGLFPRAEQAAIRGAAAARIASNPRRGYLQSVSAATGFDVERRLKEIRVPALVVVGSGDTTVPPGAGLKLAGGIAGARLRVLEGAGHVASIDAAGRLNSLILEFVDEVDGAGRPA